MESIFYTLALITFTLYVLGLLKRQSLLMKKVIKFDTWHVVFCITSIPMVFFLGKLLTTGAYGNMYTLWIPPLTFHLANVLDLKQQMKARKS